MSQVNNFNVRREEGVGAGTFLVSSAVSPYYFPIAESYPPSDQHQPSQGGSEFADGADPLFSMYLERAEEYDQKMTDRWKADADGILVFVSTCFLRTPTYARQLEIYRPGCFLPQLPHLLESPFRISSQTLRISPPSISRTSIKCSRMSTRPAPLPLPYHPFRPRSPQALPLSGSTLSGF
jgi:hypothetical protein